MSHLLQGAFKMIRQQYAAKISAEQAELLSVLNAKKPRRAFE